MNVDVFMRELSYERIEQQEAYGSTSLWSKYPDMVGEEYSMFLNKGATARRCIYPWSLWVCGNVSVCG